MTGMVGALFYWALNMSVAASVTGGVVCLARLIRPVPRQVTAWLWAAPYFRMCVPVGLGVPVSVMRILELLSAKSVTVFQPRDDMTFSALNTILAAADYYPLTYKTSALESLFGIAGWIWLIASAAGARRTAPPDGAACVLRRGRV